MQDDRLTATMKGDWFPRDRAARRLGQLLGGQVLYGVGIACLVRADLGLDPWNVLSQGVANRAGLPIGLTSNLIGAFVLLLWFGLRQRPGLGTVANVLIIGFAADLALLALPQADSLVFRAPALGLGVIFIGLGTGLYIGAGLGPGPRDGLMTGLHARGVGSIRMIRTSLELTVLIIGWLLGGTVGIGTVVFLLAIGPLVQFFLTRFSVRGVAEG